jgi:hypothetical protein
MSQEYPVKWSNHTATEVSTPISESEFVDQEQNDPQQQEHDFADLSPPTTGRLSRWKFYTGIVLILAIIGAVVGVSLAIVLSREQQRSGSNGIPGSYGGVPTIQYAGAPTTSPGPTASDAYIIADIIDSVARFGGSEFDDPLSYQSRAKKWVLTQGLPLEDGSPTASLSTDQQTIQLYALACIYYNTYAVRSDWTDFQYGKDVAIPGWFSSRGWLGSASDVCTNWYGLSCDEQGRVSKIELDTNGLTGYFPPETAYLHESLNTIDLYNNLLHNKGDLGNAFLGELTNLEYLFFGSTSFEYDGIPSQLGRLTKLKELDFSYTLYFGQLKGDAFKPLTNLKYLVMDGNAYNSSLPTELIQLPELEYLYAGFSFLHGDLAFIPRMPKIFELWIDDNPDIKGTIPTTIGQATSLVSLSATNNGLSGPIPSEIGQLTDMIQLWLYDNQLTGTIPTEFGNLIKMKTLNLQKNGLVGEMPSNLCARRRPFGRLEELEADCDGPIACDEQCCTCCGMECIDL